GGTPAGPTSMPGTCEPATASAVRASTPKMLASHAEAKPSSALVWSWSRRWPRGSGPGGGSASDTPIRSPRSATDPSIAYVEPSGTLRPRSQLLNTVPRCHRQSGQHHDDGHGASLRWNDLGRVTLKKPSVDSETPRPECLTPVHASAGSRESQ